MVRKFSDSIRQSLWAIMSCAATFPTGNAAYASCLSLEDKQAESSSMPDSANEKIQSGWQNLTNTRSCQTASEKR